MRCRLRKCGGSETGNEDEDKDDEVCGLWQLYLSCLSLLSMERQTVYMGKYNNHPQPYIRETSAMRKY